MSIDGPVYSLNDDLRAEVQRRARRAAIEGLMPSQVEQLREIIAPVVNAM